MKQHLLLLTKVNVILFFFFTSITSLQSTPSSFYNFTMDGGEIGIDQNISSGTVPQPITEITPPSMPGGTYVWVQSTPLIPSWTVIPGATSANYSPPALTVHTSYARRVTFPGAVNYETSNVVVISVDLVLPVKLIDFDVAENDDGTVQVEWATASEENNDYFLLEKSEDGINFRTIQKISGSDYSTELIAYTYRDYHPFYGENYYRLKQVDLDGEYEYSDIVSIKMTRGFDEVSIFPNPVQYLLNVRMNTPLEKGSHIGIFNSLGVLMQEVEIGNAEQLAPINVENLSAGTYFICIKNGNQDLILKKFIKIK